MWWDRFAGSLAVLGAAAFATGACAMSAAEHSGKGQCTVIGAEKLPADVGGANALCAALERAIAAKTPGLRYSAEFRVASPSALIANLVVNGRKLPEQRFGVMDRNLNPGSVERFAQSLAVLVAGANKS
jgi:hypothetical protein